LKFCGTGEWLIEKRGTKTRRSWRKLPIGMDAETGEILAAELMTNDVKDASQVGIAEKGRIGRRATLAQGWASDDRGRRRRSRPEADAGIETRDLRPHRLNADGAGVL
jgi:hypothetical protein